MSARDAYRVVVGIDLTKVSEPALREAARLVCHRPDAELHLVHVLWETTEPRGRDQVTHDEMRVRDAELRLREWVARRASEISEIPGEPWRARLAFHVRIGHPATGLEQVAAAVGADLIVVGTLGLRGLEKLMFGSIADALLARGRVPILIARENRLAELRPAAR